MKKYIFRKKHKEYLARINRRFCDATLMLEHYECKGTTIKLRMKSGLIGRFEILSSLPFIELDEKYNKPIKTELLFLGYVAVDDFSTFDEFLKARKTWKDNKDLYGV